MLGCRVLYRSSPNSGLCNTNTVDLGVIDTILGSRGKWSTFLASCNTPRSCYHPWRRERIAELMGRSRAEPCCGRERGSRICLFLGVFNGAVHGPRVIYCWL